MITCQAIDHPQPRELSNGLTVCRQCRHLSLAAVRDLPILHRTLGLQLVQQRSNNQPVSGTRNPGLNLDPRIIEARDIIDKVLNRWAAAIRHKRHIPISPKDDHIDTAAAFLIGHHDYILAQPQMGTLYAAAVMGAQHICRWLIDENPTRVFAVGRCPQPECTGTLIAHLRPHDPLLPAVIICDQTPKDDNGTPDHAWTADRWAQLGKAMQR